MHIGLHYATIIPLLAILALAASLFNLVIRDREGHRSLLKIAIIMILVGWIIYTIPFITLDYRLAEVARNSSNGLPPLIKWAVSWSGGGSSLYFFSVVVAGAALYILRRENTLFFTTSIAIVLLVSMIAATLNGAFDVMDSGGGFGINPLLKSYWIVPHPLTTFGGYGVLLVAALALLAGIRRGLVLLLAGWSLLTFGITFGAYWSYETFGWGGYWAWDPVEVAELTVWLAGVAVIHSIGPLSGLRKPMLLLLASSVPLALYVTRSGLSPLHSFAAANIGSVTLLSLSIGFLGFMLYTIAYDEESYSVVDKVKDAVVGRRIPEIAIAVAGSALIVSALLVYSSLLAPSILTAIGISATIPTMAEGVRFYHPLLYPLFVTAIVAVPIYFLYKDIGKKGVYVYVTVIGISSVASTLLVMESILLPVPNSGIGTNIMILLGLSISFIIAGLLISSLILKIINKRIIGRMVVIKLIHLGMIITFIGVLFSGSYAFNDTYFKTYNIKIGDKIEVIDGVSIEIKRYEYGRNKGEIDLFTHVAGRRVTAIMAWQGLNQLVNNMAPVIKEVMLASNEPNLRKIVDDLRYIISKEYNLDVLNISGDAVVIMLDNETMYNIDDYINIYIKDVNVSIELVPTIGANNTINGSEIVVEIVGIGSVDVGDEVIDDGMILFINFTNSVMIDLDNLYIVVDSVIAKYENNNIAIRLYDGRIIYGDREFSVPGFYSLGIYLSVAASEDQFNIISSSINSSLAVLLSDSELIKKVTPATPALLPLPKNVVEGVYLKMYMDVDVYGDRAPIESTIRFEANGEAIGIRGLVIDTIVIKDGLNDIYISVQPALVSGFYNDYHELIIYYLSEARKDLVPEEYLSLVALMSAGYNIGGIMSPSPGSVLQVERGIIDLYLLAERFDPSNSMILEEGISIMVKVVPGINIMWIGAVIMAVSGLASGVIYSRRLR